MTGTFTVHEASFDVNGQLTKFSVSFEQHCNGVGPALVGSMAWRADNPAATLPPDTSAPPAVTGLMAYPSISSVVLNWTNPTVTDWSDTIVRVALGDTAPASITSGSAFYDGRAGGAVGDGFPPGTDYTFAAFPRDYSGNVGPRAVMTVRGTSLSLSAAPGVVGYGNATTVRGRLVYSHTGAGAGGQDVFLYGRPHGSGSWGYVSDELTGPDGSYQFSVRPGVNADFEVYYYGTNITYSGSTVTGAFGSTAGPVQVTVKPIVSVALNRTRGYLGSTFVLNTAVWPVSTRQTVLIQRYYSGAWHTVATRLLNSSGLASYSVRPTARGTYLFRVVKPATNGRAAGISRTVAAVVT